MNYLKPLEVIWDYLGMHQEPVKADIIVGFGNFNTDIAARAAELWGNFAFQDRDGRPTRQDLLLGLNRISSMLYILMLREKAAYGTGETDTKNY